MVLSLSNLYWNSTGLCFVRACSRKRNNVIGDQEQSKKQKKFDWALRALAQLTQLENDYSQMDHSEMEEKNNWNVWDMLCSEAQVTQVAINGFGFNILALFSPLVFALQVNM